MAHLKIPTEENCYPWLTHYDGKVPASLSYRNVPLFMWLDEAAQAEPDTVACHFQHTKITYGQLQLQAELVAANLRSRGVQPGECVGIMLPNLPQMFTAFWGVLKAGAVVTLINPLYMEKELLHQIQDAEVKHLICYDACFAKVFALQDRLSIDSYYVTSIADALSFPYNWLYRFKEKYSSTTINIPYDGRRVLPYSTLLQGNNRLSVLVDKPAETTAVLQYTGGTTGISKGVILTHANLAANLEQAGAMLYSLWDKHQTFMAVLPLFHVYGLTTCLLLPTVVRGTVVPMPRFVPKELLYALKKYKITAFPGAPSVYIAILQLKEAQHVSLPHLDLCISGSAPLPVEYHKKFEDVFGGHLIEGYGLSETSPITHLNPLVSPRKKGSIGLPLPDTEARIVDMEVGSLPVPPGVEGELIIRGPQVMQGYWKRPDETASALRNGWLYTGDIAVMDEEGYFTIVDRKKDMIITAGYNVFPREIDEVLYEHPKVKEVVTIGVPNATRGESIKAFIVVKEGETMNKAEVVAWCKERLAHYKVPRQIEFRDSLPKTQVGKILRRTLRDEEIKHISG